jgi:hypothetical protein
MPVPSLILKRTIAHFGLIACAQLAWQGMPWASRVAHEPSVLAQVIRLAEPVQAVQAAKLAPPGQRVVPAASAHGRAQLNQQPIRASNP